MTAKARNNPAAVLERLIFNNRPAVIAICIFISIFLFWKAPSIISNPDQTLDMHLNGEEKFRPPGRYNLNMDNFHTTIDLQQALHPYGEQPMSFFHGRWIDQLYSKGEVRPIEDIIQVIHPGVSTKA